MRVSDFLNARPVAPRSTSPSNNIAMPSVLRTSSAALVTNSASSNLFKTGFDTTPGQPTGPIVGDVLPTTVSPPSQERLAKCVDDAYRWVFNGTKFPTGPERSELRKLAEKLAYEDHLSAGAIESEIAGRIRLKDLSGQGGPPVDAGAALDEALKFFDFKHVTTQAERNKWLPLAKELASKPGSTADDVKWGLISKMQEAQEGDPKDSGVLGRIMNEAYKFVFGKDTIPAGEQGKWQQVAQQLASQEGATANDVKWNLIAKMQEAQEGLDNKLPATLQRLVNDAFKRSYGPDYKPSQAELDRWTNFANEMAKDPATTATDIKWALYSKVQLAKDGLEDTSPATLDRLVKDAFRKVLGKQWREPSAREILEWNKLATQMASENKSATEIQSALISQLQDALTNR